MIAVGVDTHKEKHLAVAVDGLGQLLSEITITADLAGYRSMADWLGELEGEVLVGIEGAGSFGAGLCEYLQGEGVEVFEVERPRRRERRTGKSDRLDALIAAKKVLVGEGLSTPRGSGTRLALQMLLVAYRSVVGERSRLYNQLQALNAKAREWRAARALPLLLPEISVRAEEVRGLRRDAPDEATRPRRAARRVQPLRAGLARPL